MATAYVWSRCKCGHLAYLLCSVQQTTLLQINRTMNITSHHVPLTTHTLHNPPLLLPPFISFLFCHFPSSHISAIQFGISGLQRSQTVRPSHNPLVIVTYRRCVSMGYTLLIADEYWYGEISQWRKGKGITRRRTSLSQGFYWKIARGLSWDRNKASAIRILAAL